MRTLVRPALRAAILATTVFGAAFPRPCRADDQGVVGLKLILIDKYVASGKAKAVFVSHDTAPGAIHNGTGSGNPADVSGTVRICETAAPTNVAVYALPSPWLVNKPTISKYVNKLAAAGAAGAKVVAGKPTSVLKVVAKNLGDGDAASGNDTASDLNLNDPPGACTIVAGDGVDVEVEVVDAAGPATHHMCAHFTIDADRSIAGGTGCKVISNTSVAGPCGVCGVPPAAPPPPPCLGSGPPFCDGDCGGPGGMCLDPGGGCVCVPSGAVPCGGVAGPPLCYGECPFPAQACMDVGGLCVCRDTIVPLPPVCSPGVPGPSCDGDCGGLGTMCVDPGGGCTCLASGGMPCGVAAPFPVCYGECLAGLACRTSLGACVCAP
jgi:hypothetical protein